MPLLLIDRIVTPALVMPTTRIPFLQINNNTTVVRIIRAIINPIEAVEGVEAISINRVHLTEDSVVLTEAEVANTRICNGPHQVLNKAGLKARTFK